AGSILPLSFGGQSLACPLAVGYCIIPGNMHYRMIPAVPESTPPAFWVLPLRSLYCFPPRRILWGGQRFGCCLVGQKVPKHKRPAEIFGFGFISSGLNKCTELRIRYRCFVHIKGSDPYFTNRAFAVIGKSIF